MPCWPMLAVPRDGARPAELCADKDLDEGVARCLCS
jgi:hypothetical protein